MSSCILARTKIITPSQYQLVLFPAFSLQQSLKFAVIHMQSPFSTNTYGNDLTTFNLSKIAFS